jgi:hypothetical protein
MKRMKYGQDLCMYLLGYSGCFLLCLLTITFSQTSAQAQSDPPYVVSTIPENNATDVSQTLDMVTITFDRPMNTDFKTVATSNWRSPHAKRTWSADGKTLFVGREDDSPLRLNTNVWITINSPSLNQDYHIRDTEGNFAEEFTLTFWIQGPTRVSSTVPAGGSTDVNPTADLVSITFNKPMDIRYRSASTSNWTSSFKTNYWSEDAMTLYLPRQEIHYPFRPNTQVTITINDPYKSIQDTSGNYAEEYKLNFRIAPIKYEKIEAKPEKGFNWPYLLYIPETVKSSAVLLVEPNNSGTPSDDFTHHENRALLWLDIRSPFSHKLEVPLLIPIFPRYDDLYTQALDRATLLTQRENLVRIDLQLMAMIDDATIKLAGQGIRVDKRFFMMGFSASGAFTSRFCAIHPERIMAAAIGAPGGWPIAPVAKWWGHDMTYILGISDLHSLTGKQFNLNEFKKIPLYLYLGDKDDNWDSQDVSTELHFLGKTFQERWLVAEEIYQSIGSRAEFVMYPGIGHVITTDILMDIEAYFRNSIGSRGMPWLFLLLED